MDSLKLMHSYLDGKEQRVKKALPLVHGRKLNQVSSGVYSKVLPI